MKINNKVIALVDIILGILFVISPLFYPLFVFPSVTKMYTDFSMTNKPSFTFTLSSILMAVAMMPVISSIFSAIPQP